MVWAQLTHSASLASVTQTSLLCPFLSPHLTVLKLRTLRRGDYGAVRGARWQPLLPGPRRGLPGPHTSLSLYSCSQRSGLASAPAA